MRFSPHWLIGLGAAALALAGCVAPQPTDATGGKAETVAALNALAAQVAAEQRERRPLAPPQNAASEACFDRVTIPPTYQTSKAQVVVREATEEIEIVPAEYEETEEVVVVREAVTRFDVIPAQYRTETVDVVLEPEQRTLDVVPAKYKTVTEKVLVREAYMTWAMEGPAGAETKVDQVTGETLYRVEVPAEYTIVEKQVLVEPAKTVETRIPAKAKKITVQTILEPAKSVAVDIPAETETVAVRRLVSPTRTRKTQVPARTETIEVKKKITDERVEYHEVVCDDALTRDRVHALQTALKEKGHYKGAIDGLFGPRTMQAVVDFQVANNLPYGKLTKSTAALLGAL